MTICQFVQKSIQYLRNPIYRTLFNSYHGFYNAMSDEQYIKKVFKARVGYAPDLSNPKTFNEKLQWLKLYDHRPEYTMMVDKYRVRQYVADTIGAKYLVPLLGVWNDPDEIDFNSLPNQFVLKCNHDSGGVCICDDKKQFDIQKAKKKLKKSLKKDYYLAGREWPYKNIDRKIIAEKYMESSSGDTTDRLIDYKFMCFNGTVKCSFTCSDRFSGKGLHVTFFDRDWNVMPFERHFPSVKEGLPKPKNYDEMIHLAQSLSVDIPFVRVDFYEVNGDIYFGELTFYPGGGWEEFIPEKWDYVLGEWLTLPKITVDR